MEQQLVAGKNRGFLVWNNHDWPLTEGNRKVIERRQFYGLNYGCSIFTNSAKKDFSFFISFADKKNTPDARTEALVNLVVSELMVTRKRLNLQEIVATLSDKEVEVGEELMRGKTNWEIAKILELSEHTVKFHIKKIFKKLVVHNRQQAIGVLIAERYLSI
jgi:DNA-binding CsgD family transcriptional regulator